jgi:3-keto-5-aminohexanoate cleavage enzyme
MDKLIINAAITGTVHTRADSGFLPITPDEIAEDCRRCRDAGASIVHLHARDREGNPSSDPETYAEIVEKVRGRCPGIIICVSTSGRYQNSFEKRSAPLALDGELKPEMASLTAGSLNFPNGASVNDPETIVALAERMHEKGIVPELEIFDLGMIDYAHYLIGKQILHPPFYFNLFLGSQGTLGATPFHLASMEMALPTGSHWAGAGIGKFQFFVNSLAVTMGGHVRVGIEDNLYFDREKKRLASNAELVERIAALGRAAGREIATPDEARALIGLPRCTSG